MNASGVSVQAFKGLSQNEFGNQKLTTANVGKSEARFGAQSRRQAVPINSRFLGDQGVSSAGLAASELDLMS